MSIQTQQAVITGARHSKGQMDNGSWDFTEVYGQLVINPEQGKGAATVPYKFGDSKNFHHLFANQVLPGKFEIDFMDTTNGRGAATRVIAGIRPVQPSKAA